jgi:hypothetical protein
MIHEIGGNFSWESSVDVSCRLYDRLCSYPAGSVLFDPLTMPGLPKHYRAGNTTVVADSRFRAIKAARGYAFVPIDASVVRVVVVVPRRR